MKFKTFFYKNILMGFFVATTCISVAMAILGLLFEPDTRFGYQALLFPLMLGALTMLPSLVTYSKCELSVRGVLVRKLLQFILIEIIVLFVVHSSGTPASAPLAISLMLSVLLIYMTVNLVLWVNDRQTAKAFNKALLEMQQERKREN